MLTTARAEKYRRPHPVGLVHRIGDEFGWFEMPSISKMKAMGPKLRMQVSPGFDQYEFEHVSVSLAHRCPTWDEMCMVKDLFWDEEDQVIQYHPPKSEYVNNMQFCLHLWRYTKGRIPFPARTEVGI